MDKVAEITEMVKALETVPAGPAVQSEAKAAGRRPTTQGVNFCFFINTNRTYKRGSQELAVAVDRLSKALDAVFGDHHLVMGDFTEEQCNRNSIDFYIELNEKGQLCALVAMWFRIRTRPKFNHKKARMELINKLENPNIYMKPESNSCVYRISQLAAAYKLPPPPLE